KIRLFSCGAIQVRRHLSPGMSWITVCLHCLKRSSKTCTIKLLPIAKKQRQLPWTWTNLPGILTKLLASLRRCGAAIQPVKKRLRKQHPPHPAAFRLSRKRWRIHASVAARRPKKWYTGPRHIRQHGSRGESHRYTYTRRKMLAAGTMKVLAFLCGGQSHLVLLMTILNKLLKSWNTLPAGKNDSET